MRIAKNGAGISLYFLELDNLYMKKSFALFALAFGLCLTGFAQENLFQRTVGGSKTDNSYGIAQTFDGGFISVGSTESYGKGSTDILLIKTNGIGEVEWSKAYGESGDDIGWGVTTSRDSGYVVVGTTNSYNKDGDVIIFKTDKSGSVKWARTIKSDSVEDGYNIIRSFYSGEYYVTGFVRNDTNGDDAFVAKISSSGSIRWYRKFGSAGTEEGYGLAEDSRGNVLICGMTTYDSITNGGTSGSSGTSDAFLAKFDSTGNFKWMKTYGSKADDVAWDVKVDRDKYIMTGWTKAISTGDNDMLVITTDTSGGSSNAMAIGTTGEDRAFNVIVKPNGAGFSIAGYADPQMGNREVIFSDFNSSYNLGNTTLIGGGDRDGHWPTDIALTSDGGFAMFSTSRSFNSTGDDDLYFIKLRRNGSTLCNSTVEPLNSFNITMTSKSFGEISYGTQSQTPSVSTTTISSLTDSTLCCKLSAALPKNTAAVCSGLAVSIGTNRISGLKYTWTDDQGNFVSSAANPSVAPTKTTTYKLVVSSNDQACGKDSATIKVTVNQYLTEDFASDTSFCNGDSAVIVGSSNLISHTWVGKTINTSSKNITVSKSDTIYFSGIDVNSCTYKDTMVVTVNAIPTFSLGKDTTICEVLSVELMGPANMTKYDWNNGEGSNQTFKTNVAKTHTLAVEDANGCTYSDDIIVFTNPSSPFSLGADDSFCRGSVYTILGPGALTGYVWNDTASSLQNLPVTEEGTYYLEAYNSFNCPSFDTITVYHRDLPVFSLGTDGPICSGTSRYLVGPEDLTTYRWNNNTSNDSLFVNKGGSYWLKVTDQYNCSFTDTIELTDVNNPIITLGKDTTICGTPITLTPGSGFAKYEWSTNATTPSITIYDKNTFSVTVTDQNGCQGSASINIDTCDKDNVPTLILSSLKFYPVPANENLNLEFHSVVSQPLNLRMVDLTGRLVLSMNEVIYPGKNAYTIDVSDLVAGNYILWLHNDTGSTALKVVIE